MDAQFINLMGCRLVEVPMRLFQHLGWQVLSILGKRPERRKLKLAKRQKDLDSH